VLQTSFERDNEKNAAKEMQKKLDSMTGACEMLTDLMEGT
jgi:hypothetical protein